MPAIAHQRVYRPLISSSPTADHEGVGDVSRVVDAQPDGQHDVDTGDGVDGDAPEVEHAHHVDQGEDDAEQHQAAYLEVGKQKQGYGEDGHHGQAQVAPQLAPNHLVSLPSGVHLREGGM